MKLLKIKKGKILKFKESLKKSKNTCILQDKDKLRAIERQALFLIRLEKHNYILESVEKSNKMYCAVWVLYRILISVSSQNLFIVPEQQITSAK